MIVTKQNENNISKNYMQNNLTERKQMKNKKGKKKMEYAYFNTAFQYMNSRCRLQ